EARTGCRLDRGGARALRCKRSGNELKRAIGEKVQVSVLGLADARSVCQDGLEHRVKFAGKRTDELQHLRGGCLLVPRLVQFPTKPSYFRLSTSSGRLGTCYALRRIAAFRLWRLATPLFDRFAACFGAPLHRVPR